MFSCGGGDWGEDSLYLIMLHSDFLWQQKKEHNFPVETIIQGEVNKICNPTSNVNWQDHSTRSCPRFEVWTVQNIPSIQTTTQLHRQKVPYNQIQKHSFYSIASSHPFLNKPTSLIRLSSKRRLSLGSLLHLHYWHQARTDCSHESSSQQCTLRGEVRMLTMLTSLNFEEKLQVFNLEHLMDCRHNMAKPSKTSLEQHLRAECCRVLVSARLRSHWWVREGVFHSTCSGILTLPFQKESCLSSHNLSQLHCKEGKKNMPTFQLPLKPPSKTRL